MFTKMLQADLSSRKHNINRAWHERYLTCCNAYDYHAQSRSMQPGSWNFDYHTQLINNISQRLWLPYAFWDHGTRIIEPGSWYDYHTRTYNNHVSPPRMQTIATVSVASRINKPPLSWSRKSIYHTNQPDKHCTMQGDQSATLLTHAS